MKAKAKNLVLLFGPTAYFSLSIPMLLAFGFWGIVVHMAFLLLACMTITVWLEARDQSRTGKNFYKVFFTMLAGVYAATAVMATPFWLMLLDRLR